MCNSAGHALALLVEQVEQCCGFLADEVDAAAVVDVVDVVPGDALCPVLLLQGGHRGKKTPGKCLTLLTFYLTFTWMRLTQHFLY